MATAAYTVTRYAPDRADAWDALCRDSCNGTLLHTRRFLSYHGERFEDLSLLIVAAGALVGVLPAARDPSSPGRVVSHPGSTYGGIVHAGELYGSRLIAALDAVAAHYRTHGLTRLHYKAVPAIYHRRPAGDDAYALFRIGAARHRSDLSATIDLNFRGEPSGRRRRGMKKARQAGLEIVVGRERLAEYWDVLAANLAARHGRAPVHTLGEIRELCARFPDEIELVAGVLEGRLVAGTLVFRAPTADHAQYIASNAAGQAVGALDLVFEEAIARAARDGRRYFDFGISTDDQGRVLNDGLYEFKREFGAGGVVYEHYDIDLER